MKTASLKATVRKETGARSAKNSRNEEKVPVVLYGQSGTQHLDVDYQAVSKLIHSPNLYLINLDIEGKDEVRVIIQDTQFHPVSDRILHIDFLEAAVGKTAKLNVPVQIKGNAIGVLNGGQLVVKMRYLRIKGVPAELPEAIEVDISELGIGKAIKVADLEGFEFLDPENSVIVRVKAARKMEELEPQLDEDEEGEEGAEGEEGGDAPAAEGGDAPAAEGEKAEAPAQEKAE